jgi:hypothetical protein
VLREEVVHFWEQSFRHTKPLQCLRGAGGAVERVLVLSFVLVAVLVAAQEVEYDIEVMEG